MDLVCEAFSVPPSVALAELESDPALVFAVLDARAFAATKRAMENGGEVSGADPMVRLVFDFTQERIGRS